MNPIKLACLIILIPLASSAQDSLKILSWNIKMLPSFVEAGGKAKRAKAIVSNLSNTSFDVIVLQEVFHRRSRRIVSKGLAKQYPHSTPILNKKFISLKSNGGVMIMSKHPIKEIHEIRYQSRTGFDRMARKGALLTELDINGKSIQVVGTHLQAFGPQEVMYSQYQQLADELLKANQKNGVPQFVCGDFNTLKSMPPQLPADISQRYIDRLARYQYMLQVLDTQDGDLEGDHQYTMDRPYNDMCEGRKEVRLLLDYIMVRPNGEENISINRQVKIFQSQWCKENKDLSDHYALHAVITGY